jgi:hypothetical protein
MSRASKTKSKVHSEQAIQNWLENILLQSKYVSNAVSYKQQGVLTREKGLVVDFTNGQQFQITIVDSTN